jgi:peptidoglycan/LPS O-acetylase OafA/YrhL
MILGAKNPPLRYIPELDGLRAFAVLVVIAFHTMPKVVPNGGVGVDIFFVLSGYLITRILLSEFAETGRINFGNFYMRRFLRLTPALWLLLLAYGLDGARLGGELMRVHLAAVFYAALYVTNWIRAFDLTEGSSLNHTWSLAVEEQFYLVIPALLIVVLPRMRAGNVWMLFSLLAVVSFGWRVYLTMAGSSTARIFNGSDTRAETLLVGCIIASLPLDGLASWGRRLLPVALIFLLGAIFLINPTDNEELPNAWNVTLGFSSVALAAGCLLVSIVSFPPPLNSSLKLATDCLPWADILRPLSLALPDLHFC